MSQVSYDDSGESLEDLAARTELIVLVTAEAPKQVVIKTVVFPKRDSFSKT